jgi:hypothetical protein
MPIQVSNANHPYALLESRVVAAAWGRLPDFTVIDPVAEQEGQEFAETARTWSYETYDPLRIFQSVLLGYKGPIGKPAHEWHVETGTKLRLLKFAEPRGYELGFGQSQLFSLPFRLTLDRSSGKVLTSEPLADPNVLPKARPVWGASFNWVFDPSTIPDDGTVNVTVRFRANCSEPN